MALTNSALGAPITITVGRRGEAPDSYPAQLVGVPFHMLSATGRPQLMAQVISLQTNLQGQSYLAERTQNLAFAADRRVRCIDLDGTKDQPKTWQQLVQNKAEAAMAFLANRQPQSVGLNDLLQDPPSQEPEPPATSKRPKPVLVTS